MITVNKDLFLSKEAMSTSSFFKDVEFVSVFLANGLCVLENLEPTDLVFLDKYCDGNHLIVFNMKGGEFKTNICSDLLVDHYCFEDVLVHAEV